MQVRDRRSEIMAVLDGAGSIGIGFHEILKQLDMNRLTLRKELEGLIDDKVVVKRIGMHSNTLVYGLAKMFRKNDELWITTISIIVGLSRFMKAILKEKMSKEARLLNALVRVQSEYLNAELETLLFRGAARESPTMREMAFQRFSRQMLNYSLMKFVELLGPSSEQIKGAIYRAEYVRSQTQKYIMRHPEAVRRELERLEKAFDRKHPQFQGEIKTEEQYVELLDRPLSQTIEVLKGRIDSIYG